MSTLLATVDSTEYHFINLKDQQINGITYVRNSAIPTKYGTVDEVELCLKILSTNCLCSPSLTLIFEYIERPPRSAFNINNKYYYYNPFSESKETSKDFCSIIKANFKKKSSRKGKDLFL